MNALDRSSHRPYTAYRMHTANSITTYTGLSVDLSEPTLDMICIDDIAHALAMICHFAGHTRQFFSVAQHSVLVARIVPTEWRRAAILHDASEAYLGDLTRPLKRMLPDYKVLEHRLQTLIFHKYGVDPSLDAAIKPYDDMILKLEAKMFMAEVRLYDRDGSASTIPDLTPTQLLTVQPLLAPQFPVAAKQDFRQAFETYFRTDDGR